MGRRRRCRHQHRPYLYSMFRIRMTIIFCFAATAAHLLLFATHDVQAQAVNSDSDSHINNMATEEEEEEQRHEQQQYHQLLQEEEEQLLQEQQRQQREMEEYTLKRERDQLRQQRKEAKEAATKVDTIKNKKVKIELYYMPQCPGCRQLITSSFSEAFHTPGFSDMADVTFVSFGNAHETKTTANGNRIFDNVLEACALHYIGIHGDDDGDAGSDATDAATTTDTADSTNNLLSRHKNNQHQDTQFRYIECIDQFPRSRYSRKAHQVDIDCAKALGLSNTAISSIEECATSDRGHELAHRMVKQADSITPRINYYPWTLVNNVHNEDIEKGVWASLFHLVCNVYKGSERSEHCIADDDDDSGDTHEEDDIMDQL